MPTCQNCGNAESFVLCVECTVPLSGGTVGTPRWTTALACAACQSTHVA